ncbi:MULTISPECIES: aldehyde dehydrogenase family protein [unclassified Halomonas]|uniref:aldehyde dehydrogenase family protein n=1 Tax=unclassified Halomonas TaxID=2609666 RepID=UPI00257FB784|nr:aldehyde dehydrogenase family protein [Halomonas sp.]
MKGCQISDGNGNGTAIDGMPFGGEKNSGIGRFNGDWVLNEMTTVQWVSVQHEPRDYPF